MAFHPFLKVSRILLTAITSSVNTDYQTKSYEKFSDLELVLEKLKHSLPEKFIPESILALSSGQNDLSHKLQVLFPKSQITILSLEESVPLIGQKFQLIFSNCDMHRFEDGFDFWSIIQRSTDENTFMFVSDFQRSISFEQSGEIVKRFGLVNSISDIEKQSYCDLLHASYTIDELENMLSRMRMLSQLNIDLISERQWICYTRLQM